MSHPPLSLVISLALLAMMSGCRTVTVRKVRDGSEPGIRYALPMTVMEVRPAAGVGYTVSEHTLPDSAQTYAIDGHARFASYTLEADVAQGLLARVSLDADRSRLPAQAIESSGAALESYLGERGKRRNATADEIRKAEDAVREAELDVKKAKASLTAARKGSDEDVAEAELDLAHAELELQAAEAELQERREYAESYDGVFNTPAGDDPWSPAFFVLSDTCDLFARGPDGMPTGRVELVALTSWAGLPGPQIRPPAATWPAVPSVTPQPEIRLRTGTSWRVPGYRDGKALFKTGFVSRIGGIESAGIQYLRSGQSKAIRPDAVEFRLGPNMKDLDIWFLQHKGDFTMSPGKYILRLPVLPAAGAQPIEITLHIEVIDE